MTLSNISLTSDEQAALRTCAHVMADAARDVILPLFRSGLVSDNKDASGFDPVTEADRAAEQAMRAVLADLRPADGIFGEEFGISDGTSGLQWVLDRLTVRADLSVARRRGVC